jgi:hypothetical protein
MRSRRVNNENLAALYTIIVLDTLKSFENKFG